MRIAIVHDQLRDFGGAERVCAHLMKIFKGAVLYTSFVDKDRLYSLYPQAKQWKIRESWAARIPFFRYLYSPLRFLTPFIWESFDLQQFDVVISSSGWFMSKGVITRPETFHASYIHHQPKYLYYYTTAQDWQKHLPVKIYGHCINHFIRMWDVISSDRPDVLIANAHETKKRIEKYYRRDAIVIYPPVHIPRRVTLTPKTVKERSYYITLSRLVRSKHIELLIDAANKTDITLKIVGTGRDSTLLERKAGRRVEFMGFVPDKELNKLYKGAKGYLFASVDEEFGIAPVEAMSWGVPVIAYASGGPKETLKNGVNGYLFQKLEVKEIEEKIQKLEQLNNKEYLALCKGARKESMKYSEELFAEKIKALVEEGIRATRNGSR